MKASFYFSLVLVFGFGTDLLWATPNLSQPDLNKAPEQATISISPSQIVIIQADNDFMWGSYYLAVSNQTTSEKEFQVKIRPPSESTDFQAGEGVRSEDISIQNNGILNIKRMYPPGLTLQGIQFKVPIKKTGENTLSFTLAENAPAFFIATSQKGLVKFQAQGFESGIPPMLAGGNYDGIRGQKIEQGQKFIVEVSGLPTGRLYYFILAGIMGLILVISTSLLAWRTHYQASTSGFYD